MRLSMLLLLFTVVFGVLSNAPLKAQTSRAGVSSSSIASYAQNQPGANLTLDINVNKGGGGNRWYANPVWIAIGGLAFLMLVALVVMAMRGGGTTVVK